MANDEEYYPIEDGIPIPDSYCTCELCEVCEAAGEIEIQEDTFAICWCCGGAGIIGPKCVDCTSFEEGMEWMKRLEGA